MNTKDLVYIGLIFGVSYLLLSNQQKKQSKKKVAAEGGFINGGLDQPTTMDLPNLTPNQGMATEDSLNQANITPIGSNEPEQIFGLPLPSGIQPLTGSSPVASASQPPVFSAPVPPTTTSAPTLSPTLTEDVKPITTKTQSVINNISPCGNSFSVRLNDKDNSIINYWYDGNYYYQQTQSTLMRSVPVRITFQQYNDACQSNMNSNTQVSSKK
jgi:hypothetical protein